MFHGVFPDYGFNENLPLFISIPDQQNNEIKWNLIPTVMAYQFYYGCRVLLHLKNCKNIPDLIENGASNSKMAVT